MMDGKQRRQTLDETINWDYEEDVMEKTACKRQQTISRPHHKTIILFPVFYGGGGRLVFVFI